MSDLHHLLLLEREDARKIITLAAGVSSIGRHSSNSIIINDTCVSRFQATLIPRMNPDTGSLSYWIIDGTMQGHRSRNGTFVNQQRTLIHELKNGDIIRFGTESTLKYYCLEERDLSLQPELQLEPAAAAHSTDPWLGELSSPSCLESSQEEAATTVGETVAGVLFVEAKTLRILEANEALGRLLGYSLEEFVGLTLHHLTVGDPRKLNGRSLCILGPEDNVVGTAQYRRKDGKIIDLEVKAGYIPDPQQPMYGLTLRGSACRSEALKAPTLVSPVDSLTNANRFKDQLATVLTQSRRQQKLIAVLRCDLRADAEDSFGLSRSALQQSWPSLVSYLKSCLRIGDIATHLSGEKFALILSLLDSAEEAIAYSEAICQAFATPVLVEEKLLKINCSIGIALAPHDGREAAVLLRHADIALHRARQQQQPYWFYSPKATAKATSQLKLEKQLQQALEREELFLVYQPQVNVETGKIVGVEALLRWKHPELGLVSPATFIPLIEKTHVAAPLSEWILLTACRQNKIWQEMGFPPLRVAVNLSPQQFFHPELVRLVQHVLDVTGLDPQWLDLEITEEAIMEDVDGACQILRQLRFLGVTIAIDDFGTGYSCLSTLQQLPLQTIKIDRSYVQNLTQRSETTMVAAIISLARSFNLRVVAEGVETRQQLAALQRLHCLEMQGYQLFRPLEVEQLSLVLSRLPA